MKGLNVCLVSLLMIAMSHITATATIPVRGVVYDVGLNYSGTLSVAEFDSARVAYDMGVIRNILRCNSVRIEGEDIERLARASEIASANGLKVLFNPWKMNAGADETVRYMTDAAKTAQKLLEKNIDIVFVAGCEYSMFSKGTIPGETMMERMQWLMSLGQSPETAQAKLQEMSDRLNPILTDICKGVRRHFTGLLTYASLPMENVDWNLFDIVGIDYYRTSESAEEYVAGIDRYRLGKPVWVMEVGCCAYEGAAKLGSGGFAIFKGTDAEGNAIYEGGVTPHRSENEQADYVEEQITLLDRAKVDGVFIFVFSFPVYPYDTEGIDYDMLSFALVKSFPAGDAHGKGIPSWVPKQAFYRLGSIYTAMDN